MAISDKVRKLLWGRSGNRCSLCRIELAHEKKNNLNINIGEECHIVSSQPLGPRHRHLENFDIYDNLILLCPTDHSAIDQDVFTFSEVKLQALKASHEKWIKDTLDKTNMGQQNGPPDFLLRLSNGKQLVDIINSVYGYRFDHDELQTTEEAEKIGSFLDLLKEWGDNSDLMDTTDFAKLGISLQADIDELDRLGFWVFGMRTTEKTNYGMWDVATVRVTRQTNSGVVKIDLSEMGNKDTSGDL